MGLSERVKPKEIGHNTIALATPEGFEVVSIDEIIRCEADSNYTRIFLKDREVLISKTLKKIEERLKYCGFLRVHRHHLVNVKHIVKYIRGKGGKLKLTTGILVNVSVKGKITLMKKLELIG